MTAITVGVTGVREGLNANQHKNAVDFIKTIRFKQFQHGQCIGVDEEVAELVYSLAPGTRIISRPGYSLHKPEEKDAHKTRSDFNNNDFMHEPVGHFQRNRDIVTSSHVLIGFPRIEINSAHRLLETKKGGTIHAIKFAYNLKKVSYIFTPSGLIYAAHMDFLPVTIQDIQAHLTEKGWTD